MSHLKSALRFIGTHRSFSSLIILILTLGIGLNSAVFSVTDAILFRPMLYPDQDRLYRLLEYSESGGQSEKELYYASYQSFMLWREQVRSFDQMEAMGVAYRTLTGGKVPENVPVTEVSDGFFPMLGAKPTHGRLFVASDNRPGAPPVAVLGHQIWKRRYHGDPGIVGRSIVLDGRSHTVVGVMEPSFFFRLYADLYLPMTLDPANPPFGPGVRYLYATAHLRRGVSAATAQSEMDTFAAQMARDYPVTNASWGVKVQSVRDNLVQDLKPTLLTLLAAAGFILLIACSNVANLLLSHVVRQRGELALRSALGASRGRLIRQIMTDSTLLALIGGALGLVFAAAFIEVLPKISPTQIRLLRDVQIDYRVVLFTIAVSLLCGMLPGLFVAWKGTRGDLYSSLRSIGDRSSGGVEGRRLQGALVVAEVALTLVLLVSCGLVLKSFHRLSKTSPGFDPNGIVIAEITLSAWRYTEPDQIRTFWRTLLPRIESLPGVVAVGTTHVLPVNDYPMTLSFEIEGRVPASADENLNANFRKVTPEFFSTLRVPLVAGRAFDEHDDEHHPLVAIVSQEMARRFWPNVDPLGKQIRRKRTSGDQMLTVVGVASDVQDYAPGNKFGNTLYVPFWQDPKSNKPSVFLLVRTQGDQRVDLGPAISREVLAVDSDQPVAKVTTMDAWIFNSLSKRRFSAWILTVFAALALLLSVIGIYGVLSYNVSRRQHEMGVRLAFGAEARDVIKVVLRQGMALTALGIVMGLALAAASTRFLTAQLYEVKPGDPVVFTGIVVGISAVALLACYLPARRAARVDPIRSLKQE